MIRLNREHVQDDRDRITYPGDTPDLDPRDDLDTSSSASRQHFIDTGRYLTFAEVRCGICGECVGCECSANAGPVVP